MSLPFLLDCTLRDGGYYNAWDFDKKVVDEYIAAVNDLPIDYIEVGYRNNPQSEYLGKYAYCPVYELAEIRRKSAKKIAIMLNEKDVTPPDLAVLLDPIKGLVDMARVAVDPKNLDRALILGTEIKKRGFLVSFNIMYMSKWDEYEGFYDKLTSLNSIVDILYMVDSFGGVFPETVRETIFRLKEKTDCSIGFHCHNNLELGLINTLTAIDNGADYVDATVLGMGRGAGNLKTELLLTYLNKYYDLDVDFNKLGNVITIFSELLRKYNWGTNLPYMISGAYSIPQKDVMALVDNRRYSFNSIIRALDNKKDNIDDNAKYPVLNPVKYDQVIIIGGGINAALHADAVKEMIKQFPSAALIHATARNAVYYKEVTVPQYICLVGSEGKRVNTVFPDGDFEGKCVLPPYPRKMGTEVPDFLQLKTYELQNIEFTTEYHDSCTTVALQTAACFCDGDIFLIGYDGYKGNVLSEKEAALIHENRLLISDFKRFYKRSLLSLTPSLYKELDIRSVYQYI
ncbi:MAG: aldolase catalytic domain-containing protein [Bacteroidales bacterium]|jgi:4-hydroxy 2-oxovalerate aldolase|nr:aldolase catalytic domain-containing protein [Bacteroidales bacterium]